MEGINYEHDFAMKAMKNQVPSIKKNYHGNARASFTNNEFKTVQNNILADDFTKPTVAMET